MSDEYHYNQTGEARKEFVQAISEILEQPAVYQKAPTFAYKIGNNYTVDKFGTLSCADNADIKEIRQLLEALRDAGYLPEAGDDAFPEPPEDEPDQLVIDIAFGEDFTGAAYLNLQKIINSKANLLKLALGIERLEIKVQEGKISFLGFVLHGIVGEALAYSQLAEAMVKMAIRQKRVTAKEKPIENPRFDMRLFLVRLGMIGDTYKESRRILIRNLPGNSAWKAGKPPERRAETAEAETATLPPPTPAETVETNIDEKGGVPYGK